MTSSDTHPHDGLSHALMSYYFFALAIPLATFFAPSNFFWAAAFDMPVFLGIGFFLSMTNDFFMVENKKQIYHLFRLSQSSLSG